MYQHEDLKPIFFTEAESCCGAFRNGKFLCALMNIQISKIELDANVVVSFMNSPTITNVGFTTLIDELRMHLRQFPQSQN